MSDESPHVQYALAAGTPAGDVFVETRVEALATPAVSTAGWETDVRERPPKVPRACRE
jgi:hypothetical protein